MYHTKTAETAVVTWTHFYCNSSIESKKVLININTMPMCRSPPRTVPTPFFPPQEKKERRKYMKKKATTRVFLFTGGGFSFLHRGFLSSFSTFFCVQDIRRGKIMHIRRIHSSTAGFSFLKLFPVKLIINDSVELGGTTAGRQAAGGRVGPSSSAPPTFRGQG